MEYLALYRKWRPKGFSDFVGQAHVVRTLRNAVAESRIAHAYLFCGPRGTGKTTAAKILARAVNCTDPIAGDPCGKCAACERIAAGISLDVQEIDGASNRGIDEVRELREKVRFAPAEGRFRVYIIDEVHMLTGEAFNALLKTIEEPPPHVIFIFATTEPHRLPMTVISRCQRFDFKRFSESEIAGRLAEIAAAEGLEVEESALSLLAVQAAGGMRDAIGLLEQAAAHAGRAITQADVREVLGLVDLEIYRRLAEAIRDRDAAAALAVLAEAIEAGKDLVQFARGAALLWRDLLVLALSKQAVPLQVLPPDDTRPWKELAGAIGADRLLAAVEFFAAAAAEQKRAGEAHLAIDLALIRLASGLSLHADLDDLARRVAFLEERMRSLQDGTAPTPTAAPKIAPIAAAAESEPRRTAGRAPAPPPAAGETAGPESGEWPAVLARLRKLKPSLWSLLANAHPEGLRGQAFVLRFAHEPIARRAEADREMVERVLAEVFHHPVPLRCEIGSPSPPQEAKTDGDPVAETLRLFDGTLEEE